MIMRTESVFVDRAAGGPRAQRLMTWGKRANYRQPSRKLVNIVCTHVKEVLSLIDFEKGITRRAETFLYG
jgi:hypothetical protein